MNNNRYILIAYRNSSRHSVGRKPPELALFEVEPSLDYSVAIKSIANFLTIYGLKSQDFVDAVCKMAERSEGYNIKIRELQMFQNQEEFRSHLMDSYDRVQIHVTEEIPWYIE